MIGMKLKKGTKLKSITTSLVVVYTGKNKHNSTLFEGYVLVQNKVHPVGRYMRDWTIGGMQILES